MSLDDLLQITDEDIAKAKASGRPEFKNNEVVQFLINEVADETKDEGKMAIVKTTILTGDNKERNYSMFFRLWYATSRELMVRMLLNLLGEEEVKMKRKGFIDLIGLKFESKAKIKGEYTNFYDFKLLSDTPQLGVEEPATSSTSTPPAL